MNNLKSLPSPFELAYFVEAASSLNFSRAAERLGITQPSLSLAIQRLEQCLGEPVFIRNKRGVTLTKAGRQLSAHVRELIQTWEEVRTKAIASVDEIGGRYTIGCHASVALYSLPGCLAEALALNPKLEVQFVHDLSRKITEGIIGSSIDLGIVVNPVKHPDLIISNVARDKVTCWRSSAMMQHSKWKNDDVLIYNPEMAQSHAIIKKLSRSGIHFNRTIETSNLEVIAELTATQCGIGLMPTRVAMRAHQKLVAIQKAPVFQDDICVVIRNENRSIATLKYLKEAIIRTFPNAD